MGKKSRTARQRAIKKADRYFSLYIRWKYVEDDGKVSCYTCGSRHDPRNLHCGHFQSRRYMATRWDGDNARPQCVACNIYHQGRQFEFGRKLDAEQDGLADDVIRRSQEITKLNTDDINAIVKYYKDRVDELEE